MLRLLALALMLTAGQAFAQEIGLFNAARRTPYYNGLDGGPSACRRMKGQNRRFRVARHGV
jgi:hypothetical protein